MDESRDNLNPYRSPVPAESDDQDWLNGVLEQLAESSRFPVEAYVFVLRGFEFATTHIKHAPEAPYGDGHLDAVDLCWCFHDFALHTFGENARAQLAAWGIRCTRDFGELEFELVQRGLVRKTHDSESPDDFDNVFDFDHEFRFGDFRGEIAEEDL